MANALIGIQNDDNSVTSIECVADGELGGTGSTLYSCYMVFSAGVCGRLSSCHRARCGSKLQHVER